MPAQKYGVNAAELPHFGRYLLEIADMWRRAFGAGERTVWLQEIGAPAPWVTADRAGEFLTDSIEAVAGYAHLSAVTWWCSHDVSRQLADFPELEYTLGLIDEHGEVKETGVAMAEAIRREKAGELTGTPTSERALTVEGLALDGSNRSLTNVHSRVFEEWMAHAIQGEYLALNHPEAA